MFLGVQIIKFDTNAQTEVAFSVIKQWIYLYYELCLKTKLLAFEFNFKWR